MPFSGWITLGITAMGTVRTTVRFPAGIGTPPVGVTLTAIGPAGRLGTVKVMEVFVWELVGTGVVPAVTAGLGPNPVPRIVTVDPRKAVVGDMVMVGG